MITFGPKTKDLVLSWKGSDIKQLAYILATAWHETGSTILPIRERGSDAYLFKMYDPESPDPARAKLAKKMGALPGDGLLFPGRGYVQLTWRLNYLYWGKRLGIDLTSSIAAADRVMEPDIAKVILFDGMKDGTFTGKKLSDYINDKKCDFVNARRIINGTDCAEKIAGHANEYLNILIKNGVIA